MSAIKYRSKVVVEAVFWTGANFAELRLLFIDRPLTINPNNYVVLASAVAMLGQWIVRDASGLLAYEASDFERLFEEQS